MFDPRALMDPEYAKLRGSDEGFDFQKSLKQEPIAMNWADPYRPNDTVPAHIKKAVIESLNSTAAHYTFPTGDLELCKEVAKRVYKLNGVKIDPQKELTISNGSDSAFAYVMRPFLVPGEQNEVMMPVPSYVHNFCVPPLQGGKSIMIQTSAENDYDLDIEEMERRVTPKTRIFMFTNPNNPTGTVYKRATMEKLADFCIRHNLICIVDQCFEDSVYDGNEYVSMMSLPGMFERTITIGSISKGMGLCGFRVAYIVASKEITDVLHQTAVFVVGATNTMAQAGITAGLRDTRFMEDMRQEWMTRARILGKILDTIPHISYVKPEAGFFFWVDTSFYGTDEEVMRYLVQEANVLVSTGAAYCDPTHIRIIFGTLQDREECIHAVELIKEALERHPKNRVCSASAEKQ